MTAFFVELVIGNRIASLDELEVFEFEKEDLDRLLEDAETNNVEDLTDFDTVVFKTEEEAEKFISEYKCIYKNLKKLGVHLKGKDLPHMLYKRRYLVQTLMGRKLATYREYDRKWKPGQLFNLYDQTHFLTVKLKQITCSGAGEWKYEFELL